MEEKKNMEATEQGQTEELSLDQLDGAAGGNDLLIAPKDPNVINPKPAPKPAPNPLAGVNPFEDIPRVPVQPIDPDLRENA